MFQTNTARVWWGQDLDPGRPITMSILLCSIALPPPPREWLPAPPSLARQWDSCPRWLSRPQKILRVQLFAWNVGIPKVGVTIEGVQEGRKQNKLRRRMSMPAPRLGWGLGRHLCVCAHSVCLSSLCTGQSLLCFSPSDLFPPLALEFLAPLSTSS